MGLMGIKGTYLKTHFESIWVLPQTRFLQFQESLRICDLPTIENSKQRMQRLLSGCCCYCRSVGVPLLRNFGASSSIALPLSPLSCFCIPCRCSFKSSKLSRTPKHSSWFHSPEGHSGCIYNKRTHAGWQTPEDAQKSKPWSSTQQSRSSASQATTSCLVVRCTSSLSCNKQLQNDSRKLQP